MEGARPRVVIVDDSDDVRDLVRMRLSLSGTFDVVAEGRDGTEAIALAHEHQPDLLVLDTSMPTMDGLEALPGILAVSPATRVVVYTGFEKGGLARVAEELGAAAFINKSTPIDQLPVRLAEVLGLLVEAPRPLLQVVDGTADEAAYRRDQDVLGEHLESFREVFDDAAIGMATLTLNGTIVRANRALAEMVGSGTEELAGIDYGRLTVGRGDELDLALAAIQSPGAGPVTFEHEVPGSAPVGAAQVTVAPVRDSEGAALYAFVQVLDIGRQRLAEDELRLSEERFSLLVAAVSEYAIFMLDPSGRVASWNAGAQRIKGYAAAEIIGEHFRVFYPPEQCERRHPEAELDTALADGSYSEEGWRIRKDGSAFWASVTITAVFDAAGRHVGFAKVTRDQTERRLAEQERDRAAAEQDQFLAVTAHELRTPIALVDGSASTLLRHWDELADDDREHLLTTIRASAGRLHQLTTDLLTASRLDAGSLALRPLPTRVGDLIAGTLDRARRLSPTADIGVGGALDLVVVVDPDRMAQAVDNLVLNALHHGRAPVRLTSMPGRAGEVDVVVSDAGTGVDPAVRDRLFERFASGGPTGGAGLGLYIVRELSRMSGGDLRYEGPEGTRPTQFVLTLPAASVPEPASA